MKLDYDQTELVADLGLELALLDPIPVLFVHDSLASDYHFKAKLSSVTLMAS